MLFTTHALTGAAVGVATGNPLIGLLTGVIVHHLTDWIPHFDGGSFYVGTPAADDVSRPWNRRDWTLAIVDLLIGSTLALALWSRYEFSPAFFFGSLGGVLPDLIHVVPFWKKAVFATTVGRRYGVFHRWLHHTAPIGLWYIGISTNLALIALALIYLLK